MLVTIARFSFPHEAQLAKAQLEASGIPAHIADEHTINMNWLYSDALGGVRLQVLQEYAEEALTILQEESVVITEETEDESTATTVTTAAREACPECGTPYDPLKIEGRKPAWLTFLLLGFPAWRIRRQQQCHRCGCKLPPPDR